MTLNLICRVVDGAALPPAPLPEVATAHDGRAFSSLADQLAAGHLAVADLADLFDLWPATLVEVAFDPETEAATALTMTLDPVARTVACVRGKRDLTAAEMAARSEAREADLLAYVGTARYAREMAGVTAPGGFRIATDDRSKLLLAGSRIKAEADPTYSTKWKVSPTDRVEVPASQIIAMSDAVLAFVDACFDADDGACAAILAGTITTRAEVDAFIANALP